MVIRRATSNDLAAVAAIQAASPEAPQWTVSDYLSYDFWVSEGDGGVTGFLAARTTAECEYEVLNIAVKRDLRRSGIGRGLMEYLLLNYHGEIFLEVRESNLPARKLYEILGFLSIGRRPNYYNSPTEAAIVMKFHSC